MNFPSMDSEQLGLSENCSTIIVPIQMQRLFKCVLVCLPIFRHTTSFHSTIAFFLSDTANSWKDLKQFNFCGTKQSDV
jgi:hypothetical protein